MDFEETKAHICHKLKKTIDKDQPAIANHFEVFCFRLMLIILKSNLEMDNINDILRSRTIDEAQRISSLSINPNRISRNMNISRNSTDLRSTSRMSKTIDESELRKMHKESVMNRSVMIQGGILEGKLYN